MSRKSLKPREQGRIESVAAFVSEMSALLDGSGRPIWFRGHSGSGWPLVPGALRDDFRTHAESVIAGRPRESTPAAANPLEAAEQLMNAQFLRAAAAMLPDYNLVHAYFLAQHHGLPTRLLDWTANPLMALFVTATERGDEDGEVIALVVDWRLSTGNGAVPEGLPVPPVSERHPLVGEAVRYLFGEGPRPAGGLIVPLRPDLRSDRMLQQDACFTLHLPDSGGLCELPENSRRYQIPSAAKPKILRELNAIGVNWATLFRDLDNVARQIRDMWDLGR
jgi:hypothetical protein